MTTVKPRQIGPLIQAILPEFTLIKCAKVRGADGYMLTLAQNEAVGAGSYLEITTAFPASVLAMAVDGSVGAKDFIKADIRKGAQLAVAR